MGFAKFSARQMYVRCVETMRWAISAHAATVTMIAGNPFSFLRHGEGYAVDRVLT